MLWFRGQPAVTPSHRVKSLFWYHFYNTLSWAWAVAGWETTLSQARLVSGWETKLTGASHWIICSYANPQCQIGCLFLFLELHNLRFTYRLTYHAPLARLQFLVIQAHAMRLYSVSLKLSCRHSRRILFSYPAGAAAGYCFLLVTQAHAMRLCSVSLKFFNFFLSTTLSNVSTKCLNQFWWNLVTMINDQARRCPMTFDPVKGHSRSKGSKINIFSKTHQVHQVSWYVHNTHTHDSLQCPLQKLSD